MKNHFYSVMILIVMVIASGKAFSQVSPTLTYQGKLTEAGGPVNGNISLTFSIYDSFTGGISLWTESFPSVAVNNGIFSVVLGKTTPISFQVDKTLWIGTKVGSNPEIFPRVELTGNLYALNLALPYAASTNSGIAPFSITNSGTASTGSFYINNSTSTGYSLYAQSDGDSTGAAVHGNNLGNGFGVFGKSAGSKFASAAVYGQHVGTGDAAGAFRVSNPANPYNALFGETNGTGPALFINNLGSSRAVQIQTLNPTNKQASLRTYTDGLGNAGFFTINNPANDSSALYIVTNGTGNAITANAKIKATQFIGDGSLLTGISTKLETPYIDTITSAPNLSNLLRLVYNGTGQESVGVAHFENLNPENNYSAIFARTFGTNGAADMFIVNPTNTNNVIDAQTNGLGSAGNFRILNAANDTSAFVAKTNGSGEAIYGLNTGTGRAAVFTNANPASTSPALQVNNPGLGNTGTFYSNNPSSLAFAIYGQSAGDSTGAAVHGNNIGNGFGVFGKSAGSKFASAAVYGEHVGTGDAAGAFRISNLANPYAALYGETNGSGSALFANNLGTGRAAQIQINNAANSNAALRSFTNGLGNVAFFTLNNALNDSSALYIITNGTGSAGNFVSSNGGSLKPALNVTSSSNTGGVQGSAGKFEATGLGRGLSVEINNVSNSSRGFSSTHTGLGRAGHFQTTNASNTEPTVLVTSNSATAPAIKIAHSGSGNAIEITGGGIHYSVTTVTDAVTPITIRSVVYNVQVVGSISLNWTPAPTDGDMIYVWNENYSAIEFAGISINARNLATLIFIGGSWRSSSEPLV